MVEVYNGMNFKEVSKSLATTVVKMAWSAFLRRKVSGCD